MNVLKTLITILLVLVFQITQAQIIVNQSWVNTTGQPDLENFPLDDWDKITWSNSTIDPVGHLITVGNTLQAPGNTDILITKHDGNGQQSWQHTINGSANGHDYGTAVTTDMQGNVYVVGAVSTTNSLLDFILLKYNSLGILQWTSNWSGTANLYDVPTSIDVDLSGNIVLAGITVTASLQSDIVTQKYNSNGTLIWTAFYDNTGLNELPISVDFISGGKVEVKGFTNTSTGSWSLVNAKFSDQTGTLSTSNTTSLPQLSIEDAFAITSDELDNIYVAGSSVSSSNKNFEVIKIDNSFNIVWSNQYDGKGQQDIAKAIAVDSYNNIIVSGNSDKPTEGTDILTIKVTPSGQEIWRRNYMAPVETGEAKVSKIQVSSTDEIFLAATVDGADGKDFATYMYNNSGAIRMEQIYNSGSNNKDRVTDFQLFNDEEIYVTGTTEIPNYGTKYTTVKYDLLRKTNGNVLVGGEPHHRENEVIVKFLPQFVDTTFVDDRTKRYGDIYDVLPTNVIEDIDKRISTSLSRATAIKIFYRLSTSHNTSLTRLNETIKMPEFWSTFLLCFPAGTDMETLTDELSLIPQYIVYAHPNYLHQQHTIPNDVFLNSNTQQSLFAGAGAPFPAAHINVEPAWDLETGQGYTKVGVYDDRIFWGHTDLGDGTFGGSQVAGGWDFNNNVSIQNAGNPANSHGTATGGIIGAIRNNTTGIAGIAGGGIDAQGVENTGAQLFSLGIFDNNNYAGDDVVAPAIVEGAMFDETQEPTGYGLHIQSHSWGGPDSETKEDAVEFCYRNQCLFVASRGNDGNTALDFPACYDDDWVINVGASGTDGEYKNATNGDAFMSTGTTCNNWASSFAGDVDVIAPGVTELVTSLIEPAAPFTFTGQCTNNANVWPAPIGAGSDYQGFNGTSAAAPHVAGVAALMHGLHHINKGQWNNLAPEDFEFLIQRYAFDISGGFLNYPVGYDINNGWGRIDAAAIIQRLEAPFWRVFHSGSPVSVTETGPVEIPSVGDFVYRRYEIIHTYQDVFSPTTQIIDSWGRRSSTSGIPFYGTANDISPDPIDWAEYTFDINQNVANVTATTYRYEYVNTVTNEILYSVPPNPIRTAYSLHIFDPLPTSTEKLAKDISVNVYPNPSRGSFTIEYGLSGGKVADFYIYSISGKLIKSYQKLTGGTHLLNIDLTNHPNGIYLFQLVTEEGILHTKLVKQ